MVAKALPILVPILINTLLCHHMSAEKASITSSLSEYSEVRFSGGGSFIVSRIGLKNKVGKVSKKKIAAVAVAAVVLAGALWGGWQLLRGDTEVDFRVLSEAEIPQQIATQVIPEYRQLERALASLVDGKVYVVATRGEKPTSGYEIEMDKITLEEMDDTSTLMVYVKFRDPQPGMALTQALTYPLLVAETELTELPDQIQLKVQYIE